MGKSTIFTVVYCWFYHICRHTYGVELDRVLGSCHMFAQVAEIQRLNIRIIQLCLVFSPLSIPEDPWCWYIYLQNWVIYGVNVGKYSIHGAYGYGYGWNMLKQLPLHFLMPKKRNTYISNSNLSGWWLTYPSEKNEFVSWDHYSQLNGKIQHVPNHQPGHLINH